MCQQLSKMYAKYEKKLADAKKKKSGFGEELRAR